ncbi:MAG: aspartate--tRNA ligase [Alphaproteobacteria bacterium]
MHTYRTHTCGALRKDDVGQIVRLSGWIHKIRDHGGVLFIDLRDTYGLTQCVVEEGSALIQQLGAWRNESVITVDGTVMARQGNTANAKMPTGEIEVMIQNAVLQSAADVIPLQIAEDDGAGEDVRLKYRYLDLRRQWMQDKIRLRNRAIFSVRRRMVESGFQEFQTPILTASSPEGARDFLVPARLHPGKFYALPQAPQQFKQLLMISGFDRYFQIAPCFRDEDSRASRLAEHYQLDVEMSFVTQDDVFATMEVVLQGLFEEFSDATGVKHSVTKAPWQRIPFREAMLKYGSDKPDLRNPLIITEVTDVFARDDVEFKAFKGVIAKGGVVRAIRVPGVAGKPRSFFDKLNSWAQGEGAPGLGYITFEGAEGSGPIAKFVPAAAQGVLREKAGIQNGDAVFFVCDMEAKAAKFAGMARDKICDDAELREKGVFKFSWIVDFPMYEKDEKTGKVEFSHNPFSMPQGGLESLNTKDPLEILAHQYDCVCNGHELCSGAIRNHKPEIMEKAFSLVGYGRDVLEKKFGGMLNAMRFGAPPHGGCGFGIDRIVMLLSGESNLREINAFVMNGQYEDPMMGAPGEASPEQLKDLHLKLALPVKMEKVV